MKKLTFVIWLMCLAAAWSTPVTPTVTQPVGGISVGTATFQSAAVATGAGNVVVVGGFSVCSVQIVGITSATVTFEGSVDGTHFVSILATNDTTGVTAATATANGVYSITVANKKYIQCRISTWVSGAITITGNFIAGKTSGGTVASSGGSLTVGTTAISGGVTGGILFDTGSTLRESANLTFFNGIVDNICNSSVGSAGFEVDAEDSASGVTLGAYGSATGGISFGVPNAHSSKVQSYGGTLTIGSPDANDVVLGTNDTAAMTISGADQSVAFHGTINVTLNPGSVIYVNGAGNLVQDANLSYDTVNLTIPGLVVNGSADLTSHQIHNITDGTAAQDGTTVHQLSVLQVVESGDGVVHTGTGVIPADDTIPQNTEGDEYYTVPITPHTTTSTFYVTTELFGATSYAANETVIAAIFRDSGADAIGAGWLTWGVTNQAYSVRASAKVTSGSLSSTVFKVRCGGAAAATTTINGSGGGRFLGGSMYSYIRVMEVQ